MKMKNVTLTDILKALDKFDSEAMPSPALFNESDILHSYSRAQAIEDGVLIDVSKQGRELGIVHPVAVTASAWADTVANSPDLDGDENKRLSKLIACAQNAIDDERQTEAAFIISAETLEGVKHIRLRVIRHPGDDMRPVITVMLADED